MSERDIVERLRSWLAPAGVALDREDYGLINGEAAEEIERLRSYEEANIEGGEIIIELTQEIERLREALRKIAEHEAPAGASYDMVAIARAALEPKP